MASVLPDYEYDIFISYRQKDNKYDGWVTEFVANLRKELEATFKEDISIYFDENPHDGLLESHQVDKSLEGKLKCLILIPILSRTYCDPASFAWSNEFVAFNRMTRADSLGGQVQLRNGNVASRVLPLQIHELGPEDISLTEKELGGRLRSINFVYKEPGVNRPLKPTDNKDDNIYKTSYRNQVNKVANAILEIITAIKELREGTGGSHQPARNKVDQQGPTEPSANFNRRGTLRAGLVIGLILLVIVVGLFLFYFRTTSDSGTDMMTAETSDKSVAVLPFEDISENHDQGYFTDGMMVEILDRLYKIKDLRTIPRSSTLGYKDSSKPIREIGRELGVATLLQGTVRKAGDRVRISVQLIDAEKETTVWQQTYEHTLNDIFSVQSDVAQQIASSLQASISPEVKLQIESIPTANQKAYDLFLRGRAETAIYWEEFVESHLKDAMEMYRQAIALDPNFSNAYAGLGQGYWLLAHFSPDYAPDYWRQSKYNIEKSIALDPDNGWAYAQLGIVQHLWNCDRQSALKSYQKAVELSPSDLTIHNDLIYFYVRTEDCDKAADELQFLRKKDKSYTYAAQELFTNSCKPDWNAQSLKHLIGENEIILATFNKYLLASFMGESDKVIEFWQNEKQSTNNHRIMTYVGEAYALLGKTKLAYEILQQLKDLSKNEHVSKCYLANIYMALGEEDVAYRLLEEALSERDYFVHVVFQFYVSLNKKRSDPRMRAIIDKSWIPRPD